MPPLDAKVAAKLDEIHNASDNDDDALFDALEDDAELGAYREQRMQQLHSELQRAKQLRESGNGSYLEIKEEKVLMETTTSNKFCIVHFFKPDFNRCRIMDGHLDTLAKAHLEARVIKINVDNAPFLVVKLKVQVLPCVLAFVDGISVDRIVGFEGLARGDAFTTRQLEQRLLQAGVLERAKLDGVTGPVSSHPRNRRTADSDDDDEWD